MHATHEAQARHAAQRALAALAGPELADAAVATAAAIVAERALAALEQRLLTHVRSLRQMCHEPHITYMSYAYDMWYDAIALGRIAVACFQPNDVRRRLLSTFTSLQTLDVAGRWSSSCIGVWRSRCQPSRQACVGPTLPCRPFLKKKASVQGEM
jgi:hypothetical protein